MAGLTQDQGHSCGAFSEASARCFHLAAAFLAGVLMSLQICLQLQNAFLPLMQAISLAGVCQADQEIGRSLCLGRV